MISHYTAVSDENVHIIEAKANEYARNHVGELVMCEIIDEVQSELRELDPGKDSADAGCGPDQCNTCATNNECTSAVLSKVTQEEIDAVPVPSYVKDSVSNFSETNSSNKKTLTEEQQKKVNASFDPNSGVFLFIYIKYNKLYIYFVYFC